MRIVSMCKRALPAIALVAGMAAATPASAASYVNVIPTNWTFMAFTGPAASFGNLRAGSPWGAGSTPSDLLHLIDGFEPEGAQWNANSAWWDADPSIPSGGNGEVVIGLDAAYTFSKLGLQGDDNDGYAVDYWDGSAWQEAHDFGALPSFGLRTRPQAVLAAPITTDRLRIRAYGGDNYFGIGEIQGFVANRGVPEPSTWAMMVLGFGVLGAAARRRVRARVAYAR